jgi:hypothetical protein
MDIKQTFKNFSIAILIGMLMVGTQGQAMSPAAAPVLKKITQIGIAGVAGMGTVMYYNRHNTTPPAIVTAPAPQVITVVAPTEPSILPPFVKKCLVYSALGVAGIIAVDVFVFHGKLIKWLLFRDIYGDVAVIKADVADMKPLVTDTAAKATRIETGITQVQRTVDGHTEQLTGLGGKIDGVRTVVDAHTGQLTGIEAQEAALARQVEQNHGQVRADLAKLAEGDAQLKAALEELDGLEKTLDEKLTQGTAALKAGQEALAGRFAKVEEGQAALTGKFTEFGATLQQIAADSRATAQAVEGKGTSRLTAFLTNPNLKIVTRAPMPQGASAAKPAASAAGMLPAGHHSPDATGQQ